MMEEPQEFSDSASASSSSSSASEVDTAAAFAHALSLASSQLAPRLPFWPRFFSTMFADAVLDLLAIMPDPLPLVPVFADDAYAESNFATCFRVSAETENGGPKAAGVIASASLAFQTSRDLAPADAANIFAAILSTLSPQSVAELVAAELIAAELPFRVTSVDPPALAMGAASTRTLSATFRIAIVPA